MLKTWFLLKSIVSRSSLDFEGSLVFTLEPNWLSRAPRTLPKVFKIQFFGHMCPRCFSRGSKGDPRSAQRSIFEAFSMNLWTFFRYFWLWKPIILTDTPVMICTCWVTTSFERYILTDFKPHVQRMTLGISVTRKVQMYFLNDIVKWKICELQTSCSRKDSRYERHSQIINALVKWHHEWKNI